MSAVLDGERVKAAFALYSGEEMADGSPRAALCGKLCEECAAVTEAILENRPAEMAEKHLLALENWAAAEAFYHLTLADGAGSPERVSADGVEIVEGERSRRAKALAEEKRLAAQPALGEEGFYFGMA